MALTNFYLLQLFVVIFLNASILIIKIVKK